MEVNNFHSEADLKVDYEELNPICRCCLSTDRNMKNVLPYEPYFRDLAGFSVMESDGLPQWLCLECIALLLKAVRFKQKMLRAHNLLYEYLTRCAPFPIDAQDPELSKYASPHLAATNVLICNVGGRGKTDFQECLLHKSQPLSDFTLDAPHPVLVLPPPPSPLPEEPEQKTEVKEEQDEFNCDYDDDITLEEYRTSTKLTDEDIKQLLEDSTPAETLEEPEPKRKKKTKKKDAKGKKKKNLSEDTPEVEEPKPSIRKREVLDPTKIRVITLNPEEQHKQREAESKTGMKYPFQCHLCFKGFNFEAKLENHMKKHSPARGPYECKICHIFLPTAYSFGVHSLIHTRRFECVECGRRMIDRPSILDHYRTQHEGLHTMYTCQICGKVSTNNKTHRGHMRNHHSGDRPKCDLCGNTFVNKDALAEHLLIHQGVKNYECETCGSRFRTRAQAKHHQLTHSNERDFYCVECDVRFKSAHSLRQHLTRSLKHKDKTEFTYGCNRCEKRFETERALRAHFLVQHEGARPHRCPQCPAALASRGSLLKHQHSVHKGVRPPPRHVCDTCGKAFRGKSVLTNHVRTHTGEKPFVCSHCGRGFSQKTAMRTHIKLVHLKIRRRSKTFASDASAEAKALAKEPWAGAPPPCDLYFQISA